MILLYLILIRDIENHETRHGYLYPHAGEFDVYLAEKGVTILQAAERHPSTGIYGGAYETNNMIYRWEAEPHWVAKESLSNG